MKVYYTMLNTAGLLCAIELIFILAVAVCLYARSVL